MDSNQGAMNSNNQYEAKMSMFIQRISREIRDVNQLYKLLEVSVLQVTTAENLPIMLVVLAQLKASFAKSNNLNTTLHDMGVIMMQFMKDDRFINLLEQALHS